MKKIALIMDGWKRFFTYAWPAGILQRIKETNEDVNLYIFNSAGNWSRDEAHNVGEYNIYNLPDLNEFDGIIVDVNNIIGQTVCDNIIEKAVKAGVPAISLANEIRDFYYVGINNYEAQKEMIEHLHKKHGCEKFWFVMGPDDNYESNKRAEALRDYMTENNLPFTDDQFYFGNFEVTCGINGFEKLLTSHGELPDAVVCANDNIAVGVCEAARERGLSIPTDFLVTGFDNFDKASHYDPRITTISHIREEMGYLCADLLLRIWQGEKVDRYNYTNTKCVFWDSCGCESQVEVDDREFLRGQIMYGVETDAFDDEVLALEYELIKCLTVQEMMYCIPQCIPSMKCDAMYLILDDNIDNFKKQAEGVFRQQLVDEDGFAINGYAKEMKVKFAYENGELVDLEQQCVSGLFPLFDYEEGGKDFLFMPLHFREYTVGYLAIRNAVYLMEKQYLFQVVNALTTAMENLHKKEKLEYMNQTLSNLYVKDSLTGIYNRLGYQKLAKNCFDILHSKKKKVLIMFADLDRLKYINDNFGHEHGDFAIITMARVLLKYSDADAIPARTGGDEFVLVQAAPSDEAAVQKLVKNIQEDIALQQQFMQLPFEMSASIGVAVTDPNSDKSFEEYVREADEMMYNDKMAKNATRHNSGRSGIRRKGTMDT